MRPFIGSTPLKNLGANARGKLDRQRLENERAATARCSGPPLFRPFLYHRRRQKKAGLSPGPGQRRSDEFLREADGDG